MNLRGFCAGILALLSLCGLPLAPAAWANTSPQRIVTLAPHLAELTCAAGACERLVGVSEWSDFPAELKTLPTIGNGYTLSLEAIVALKPDLILAWQNGTPISNIERLRALGLRVETVRTEQLESVADALRQIGQWLNTSSVADRAAQDYLDRLSSLQQRWHAAAPVRSLFLLGLHPSYTVNAHSPISAAISLCGGINVFADLAQVAAPVSAEALLLQQPTVVIFGSEENHTEIEALWQNSPASRRPRRYCAVNSDLLSRATPRLTAGIEQVCGCLDQARSPQPAPSIP